VLTDRGLGAALEALAQRTPVPLDIDLALPRLPPPVETTAYFVVVEALANVTRYATATTVWIRGQLKDDGLELSVRDDGRGGATMRPGGGLAGLEDRAAALGGTIRLDSQPDHGTAVTVRLPMAAVRQ
jgi:signal transduction histidine kinase